MDYKSINEKIANGEFEIFVEAGVTNKKQKFMSLDSLVHQLKRYSSKLDQLTPQKLGKLLPIVMIDGEFSIALGMVVSEQGNLLEPAKNIEESARLEIIQKFKEAEKTSISSIKDGNKIARDILKSKISREELEERLVDVADENVVRSVIGSARDAKTVVDFKHSSQTIGGSLDIPKDVAGSQKISYQNCRIVAFAGNDEFDIAIADDNEIRNPQNSIRVSCDKSSPLYVLMRLAGIVSASFDCEVRAIEKIKSKKLKLMVINLPDPMQIVSVAELNVSELKKRYQSGFDFK